MTFKQAILGLTAISLCSIPAFAANQTFTCERTVDANGNFIYTPVTKKVTAKKAKHRRVARAPAKKRVIREENKVVRSAPMVVDEPVPVYRPEPKVAAEQPVVRERTAAEERQDWLRKHMVTGPIYGNLSGSAGRSTISFLHGTDNPWGKIAFNNDEGPSAMKYSDTASEHSDEF